MKNRKNGIGNSGQVVVELPCHIVRNNMRRDVC